jgi:cyclophilin family peptidyl-prolyl cis-trans isomerase
MTGSRTPTPVRILLAALSLAIAGQLARSARADTLVRFNTSNGTFDVGLYDDDAPLSVALFLAHVAAGNYQNTMIHAAVPGTLIVGGTYRYDGSAQVEPRNFPEVTACPPPPVLCPVPSEPPAESPSNVRGTLSLDLRAGAGRTTQWFINLADNPQYDVDDPNTPGDEALTVFGRVVRDRLTVPDAISRIQRFQFEVPWHVAPMRNYTLQEFIAGVPVDGDNVVLVSSIEVMPDADGDLTTDAEDNCPIPNRQQDFDMDGVGDACDSCLTIADSGTDPDMDGIDQACDTCLLQPNPAFSGPLANRTRISDQLDDDADGRGNACDFDYDNSGSSVTAADLAAAQASFGRLVSQSTCGAGGNERCGEFDHDGAGAAISQPDLDLATAAVGQPIDTAFPTCTACSVGVGWSGIVGTPRAEVGRPICESAVPGVCAYAP